MGAQTFSHFSPGKTAQEAFLNAVSSAGYESGHGGYTGTIAEKREFIMISPSNADTDWIDEDYVNYAYKLAAQNDPRVSEKWGPAGCMKVGEDRWLFFGWASS